MEEMMSLDGDDMDLRMLARSFSTGPVRVEKRDEHYLLILEDEGPREDAEVRADGDNALAQMTAIMLADGSNFRPPRIRGITKKNADGTLSHYLNLTARAETRTAAFVTVRRIGPDGKEIVENKGPTEDQVALELARNNEPLRRAQVIYGSLKHDWGNLYKVLEAMEDGNGGEAGLIAKHFVADRDIKNFKATANSFRALGLESRHGTTTSGIPEPKMTLQQAEEMFRRIFQGWIKDLKGGANS
jgi:hypothetical protein